MHAKFIMKFVCYFIIIFMTLLNCSSLAQTEMRPSKINNTLPTVEEIKEAISRIKDNYVNSTVYKIINVKTGEEIKDFTNINPDAGNDTRTNDFTDWAYTNGVLYSAFIRATEVTGDSSFIKYAIKNYDFIFDHLPYFQKQTEKFGPKSYGYGKMIRMFSLDHCGSIGAALIKTYLYHKDSRYRSWIDTVDNYVSHTHYRNEDGALARHRPQPSSLWTDDFYMCIPFLTQMGKLTGNTKYFDDAVNQVIQLSKHLFVPSKGLFDHGWNANTKYDPKIYWSRANGWATMAMTELLDVLPENYKGRDEVIDILNKQIQALAECQDASGLWHNLLDKNDSYLETSGSAMFVYGIAKGINRGWIHFTYGPVALAGWNALAQNITADGKVKNACVGSTFSNDITYYYSRPKTDGATFGNAPVVLAGVEMIKLLTIKTMILWTRTILTTSN
jgi:unsaturated rhamnogalacturonyl hydrolase